tara:strand:- start:27 stop:350 length:324 start_codon:yes stop_codon:yes gene_type:complete
VAFVKKNVPVFSKVNLEPLTEKEKNPAKHIAELNANSSGSNMTQRHPLVGVSNNEEMDAILKNKNKDKKEMAVKSLKAVSIGTFGTSNDACGLYFARPGYTVDVWGK